MPKRKRELISSIDYLTDLHTKGYIVFKNVLKDVNESVLKELNKQVDKRARSIFNPDRKRLQCKLDCRKKYISDLTNEISTFIKQNVNIDCLTFSPFVILKFLKEIPDFALQNLKSKEGCLEQSAHTDKNYIENMEYAEKKNKNLIPLLVLVSLMPNTFLNVWENSINLITKEKVDTDKIEKTKLVLNMGDIVIFRSDLIHAGSDYSEENVRLHCYLDSPTIDRVSNRTFIIKKHASQELRDTIKN